MPQSGFEDGFTVASSGSLDTWVKEIFAKVPSAVEGYIYDQVKLVIADFYKSTKSWRNFFGPYTALANDGTICLNPIDAKTNVIQVLAVARNGIPLANTSPVAVPRTLITQLTSSTSSSYYVEPYHTIHLVPIPTKDVEDIFVTAALTPRLRADNRIDQWVIDQHYEAILAGTLQRLYQEPGKVYSNVTSAEYWGRKYRYEKTVERSNAMNNYKESPQPWVYPTWSRGK